MPNWDMNLPPDQWTPEEERTEEIREVWDAISHLKRQLLEQYQELVELEDTLLCTLGRDEGIAWALILDTGEVDPNRNNDGPPTRGEVQRWLKYLATRPRG